MAKFASAAVKLVNSAVDMENCSLGGYLSNALLRITLSLATLYFTAEPIINGLDQMHIDYLKAKYSDRLEVAVEADPLADALKTFRNSRTAAYFDMAGDACDSISGKLFCTPGSIDDALGN